MRYGTVALPGAHPLRAFPAGLPLLKVLGGRGKYCI